MQLLSTNTHFFNTASLNNSTENNSASTTNSLCIDTPAADTTTACFLSLSGYGYLDMDNENNLEQDLEVNDCRNIYYSLSAIYNATSNTTTADNTATNRYCNPSLIEEEELLEGVIRAAPLNLRQAAHFQAHLQQQHIQQEAMSSGSATTNDPTSAHPPTSEGGGSSSSPYATAKKVDPNHFPSQLYKMLEEIDSKTGAAGEVEQATGQIFSRIVSWQPHGKCFLIHNEDKFSNVVLPKYFCRLKYTSFQRQLHFHGFSRLCKQGM